MPSLSRLRNFARRYPDGCGVALLLLLCVAVFWPLLTGKAFFFGDLELYFYPLGDFWHRELSRGNLPLWNPTQFGGVSFAGNPQIGLLYPTSVLLRVFPVITALSLSAIFHVWGSGAFFFLWMRRGQFKLGSHAALLGAVCWMLGGAFVSKTQFPNMLAALAYLPAALWAAEALAARPSLRPAAILGLVLGLQLLAAHAQVSLYTLYLTLFYGLWQWKTARTPLLKVASGFAFALMLALLLDSGQLLPILENIRGAQRQVLTIETAPRFVLPLWAVTNLFAPYLYGNPNSGTWTFHGGGNAWETACYMGVLPFLLTLAGLKRSKFWAVTALVCLLAAMGPVGGLYLLFFKLLPGVSRFHDAARFLMLVGLASAVLAALGFQKLRDSPKAGRFAPIVLLLCVLDLGIFAHGFYPVRVHNQIIPSARSVIPAEGQSRVWSPDAKIARRLLLHYDDYTLRTGAYDALFPVGAIPNTHIWNGLQEAGGYDPIAPGKVMARLDALQLSAGVKTFPPDYAQRLGRANIRYLALWRQIPLASGGGLHEIYRGSGSIDGKRLSIYRNDFCLPRVSFLSPKGTLVATDVEAGSANTLQIQVPATMLDTPQLDILDNAAPGWRGFENGKPIQVRSTPAGYMHLELQSTPASRNIRLVYAPQSFRFGVFLSLCALSTLTAIFWITKKPKTK